MTGATHSYQTNESYSYDANGNRTNTGYTTGTDNRLTSDGTSNYTYDAEGNRTRKTTIASGAYVNYTWDHRNRLRNVTFKTAAGVTTKQVAYTYDLFNRRIGKRVDDNGDGIFDRAYRYVYDSAGKRDPATGTALEETKAKVSGTFSTDGLVNLSSGLGTLANPAPLFYANGLAAISVDPLGRQTSFEVDRFGGLKVPKVSEVPKVSGTFVLIRRWKRFGLVQNQRLVGNRRAPVAQLVGAECRATAG